MNQHKLWGSLLLIVGIILLLTAGGLSRMNHRQDVMAGKSAAILLDQLQLDEPFDLALHEQPALTPTTQSSEVTGTPNIPATSQQPSAPEEETNQPMPVKTIAGYNVVGVLQIPTVGLELPILDQWDYDLLQLAPCRYSGSIATDDLILMGHNYRSHFKPLYQVQVGDEVHFDDVTGTHYSYTVSQIDNLRDNEVEKLPSAHPLTIFTCKPGGQSRLVLRCDLTTD